MNTELFKRFYTGSLSRKDGRDLLESEEVNRLMEEQWGKSDEMKSPENAPDFKLIFNTIQSRKANKGKTWQLNFYKYAAGFVLLIGLASAALVLTKKWNSADKIQFANQSAEVESLFLPDGSQVLLAENSKVVYPSDFQKNRVVELDGLAYFKVVKNQTPFRVNTGKLSIAVTGTSFSVLNRTDYPDIETVLVEGIVIVSDSNGKLMKQLMPDEKLIVNKESGNCRTENVNARELTLWKEPKLSFNNTPLSEIAGKLSIRFGLKMNVSEKAADYRFTFSLNHETLDESLALIKTLAPVEVKQSGNTLNFDLKK